MYAKFLSPSGNGACKGSLDPGGGGGGGDVLVVAADHSGFSGQVMARGGLELADPTFVNGTNPRDASGTVGSAILWHLNRKAYRRSGGTAFS